MSNKPSSFARWSLKLFIDKYEHDSLIGDFCEMYEIYAQDFGQFRARLWYWGQIIRALPAFIRNASYWSVFMFKNYLKTALRYIKRQKTFTFINIFGMGIGIACCILILLFVQNELTCDGFHENADDIYRIYTRRGSPSGEKYMFNTPGPLAPAFNNEFAGAVNSTRIGYSYIRWLTYEDKSIKAQVTPVDPSLFKIFSFPLEKGNPGQVLSDISGAVLSKEVSAKLYGQDDPIGRLLRIRDMGDFVVTGVLEEIPANSSLRFDVLVHINNMYQPNLTSWGAYVVETYVQLQKHSSLDALESQFPGFVSKHLPEWLKKQASFSLHLQPLKDVYLNRQDIPGLAHAGSMAYIYILSGIALLIAIIACINFMNLSIVNSSGRTKEISMRKILGAVRSQIIKQFMGEAFLFSLLALILGFVLAGLFLPIFSELINKNLELVLFIHPTVLLGMTGILLFFTLLSGGYPALFLSRFHFIETRKGGIQIGRKRILFRKILVIAQFSLSLMFIIAAVSMRSQLEFLRTKSLGFNEEHVVVLPYPEGKISLSLDTIKTELRNNPNIINVAGSLSYPGRDSFFGGLIQVKGEDDKENIHAIFETIDDTYIPTLGIKIIKGRNFSRDFSTDASEAIIVNETFVQRAGLKFPLGKELGSRFRKFQSGTIIGVVKDFHLKSLLYEVEPAIFIMKPIFGLGYILVRLKSENIHEGLGYIEKKWRELAPGQPYEYNFLDEEFNKHYHFEQRWSKIVLYASLLAIFIACLGMFGLVGLIVVQRTKEIGIRKVLGASISNIVVLLTKEFTALILVSNIIAWPVTYIIIRRWLQDYPYRITLGISLFLLASLAALLITLLTISFQAVKAALADPVDTLRYE